MRDFRDGNFDEIPKSRRLVYCQECSNQIKKSARICHHCGQRVSVYRRIIQHAIEYIPIVTVVFVSFGNWLAWQEIEVLQNSVEITSDQVKLLDSSLSLQRVAVEQADRNLRIASEQAEVSRQSLQQQVQSLEQAILEFGALNRPFILVKHVDCVPSGATFIPVVNIENLGNLLAREIRIEWFWKAENSTIGFGTIDMDCVVPRQSTPLILGKSAIPFELSTVLRILVKWKSPDLKQPDSSVVYYQFQNTTGDSCRCWALDIKVGRKELGF